MGKLQGKVAVITGGATGDLSCCGDSGFSLLASGVGQAWAPLSATPILGEHWNARLHFWCSWASPALQA
jgi:hypothetical protein